MMTLNTANLIDDRGYLFGSRLLTHGLFWMAYYVVFSLIWMREEHGYFASFYLEFLLLPPRILCVYCVVYVLIPRYLLERRFSLFLTSYIAILSVAASLQSAAIWFFYDGLLYPQSDIVFSLHYWIKNLMLINSTVVFIGAISILKHYLRLRTQLKSELQRRNIEQPLELVVDRRTYFVELSDIAYIQGMGNYVEVYLCNGKKLTTYSSIKSMLSRLTEGFVRVHKSYIVNTLHIESFSASDITVLGRQIPRGKEQTDHQLSTRILRLAVE
ncbi:LytTR family DNA-binding domain-containing protein [Aliiglaciecola sp. M165]|uniref:LytR/AlgR family response regulator transcription factor n=1 Tax=Aliiglaciecola sp. M165 TaxID=2593649 RepID=UPI00163DA6E1|nr:LytTR family DNA-binding domain-containing protein [Aliiglaciecola sp. M165]